MARPGGRPAGRPNSADSGSERARGMHGGYGCGVQRVLRVRDLRRIAALHACAIAQKEGKKRLDGDRGGKEGLLESGLGKHCNCKGRARQALGAGHFPRSPDRVHAHAHEYKRIGALLCAALGRGARSGEQGARRVRGLSAESSVERRASRASSVERPPRHATPRHAVNIIDARADHLTDSSGFPRRA